MKGYWRTPLGKFRKNHIIIGIALYLAVPAGYIRAEFVAPFLVTAAGLVIYDFRMVDNMKAKLQKQWAVNNMFRKNWSYLVDDWSRMLASPDLSTKEHAPEFERVAVYNQEEFVVVNRGFSYNEKVFKIVKSAAEKRNKQVFHYDKETFAQIVKQKPKNMEELAIFAI